MGQLIHGNFGGSNGGLNGIWKAPVVKANFKKHRVTAINGQKVRINVGHVPRAPRPSKKTKMAGASYLKKLGGHEGVYHTVTAIGAGLDYHANRQRGLSRKQSAAATGLNTGIALGAHHLGGHYAKGFGSRVAVDVGGHLLSHMASERLVKHYQANNRQKVRRR